MHADAPEKGAAREMLAHLLGAYRRRNAADEMESASVPFGVNKHTQTRGGRGGQGGRWRVARECVGLPCRYTISPSFGVCPADTARLLVQTTTQLNE